MFLIHGGQVAISFLVMPRSLAEISGSDGWIGVVCGWVFAVCGSLLTLHIMKRQSGANLLESFRLWFGKWMGTALALAFTLYTGLMTVTILYPLIGYFKIWLLPATPAYIVMAMVLLPTYIIAGKGLKLVGKYVEFSFIVTIWLLFLLLLPAKEGNLLHLLPLFKSGLMPVIKSIRSTVLAYLGFELAFVLYPYLKQKEKAVLAIIAANTITLVYYMTGTLTCFVFFSPDEITTYTWPVLSSLQVLTTEVFERLDILFLSFYILIISSSWIPYLFCTIHTFRTIWTKPGHKNLLLLSIILLVLSTVLYTPSMDMILQLQKKTGQIGLYAGYFLPLGIWIILILKGLNRKAKNPQGSI